MAQFNLEQYETVAQRIQRLYDDWPLARIETHNLTTADDRTRGQWVVKAELYLPFDPTDPAAGWYLKSTGLAFETDGQGMANKTSGLENCETSAIGRCMANANYGGDLRVSREEMEKVQRGTPAKPDFVAQAEKAKSKDEVITIWRAARDALAGPDVLRAITSVGEQWK